jgi:hypothetical protein
MGANTIPLGSQTTIDNFRSAIRNTSPTKRRRTNSPSRELDDEDAIFVDALEETTKQFDNEITSGTLTTTGSSTDFNSLNAQTDNPPTNSQC